MCCGGSSQPPHPARFVVLASLWEGRESWSGGRSGLRLFLHLSKNSISPTQTRLRATRLPQSPHEDGVAQGRTHHTPSLHTGAGTYTRVHGEGGREEEEEEEEDGRGNWEEGEASEGDVCAPNQRLDLDWHATTSRRLWPSGPSGGRFSARWGTEDTAHRKFTHMDNSVNSQRGSSSSNNKGGGMHKEASTRGLLRFEGSRTHRGSHVDAALSVATVVGLATGNQDVALHRKQTAAATHSLKRSATGV